MNIKTLWIATPLLCLTAIGCAPGGESANNRSEASLPDAGANMSNSPQTATLPREGRTVAVNVQGVAPVGLTVRVKTVELGTDATILDISASYGGTITNDVALAGAATYLLDEQGNKLMLKAPQDNRDLRIVKGQTMDGKLVFLGAVADGAKSLKLVFNDNNDGASIVDPGLTIPISLDGANK